MNSLEKKDVALCIDCDGTLLHTDLLHESILLLVKQAPLSLMLLPVWLMRGKAYLKERIAERVRFDWSTLPYNDEVLKLIAKSRANGRSIVLATASPHAWASGIAEYLGIFDVVLATANGINLSGKHKAQRLSEMYGQKQFDYAGNGRSDLPVWTDSRLAIVVSSNASLVAAAGVVAQVTQVIGVPRVGFVAFLKGLRVHQWMKNMLVLVPLLAAHKVSDLGSITQAVLAFLAFSLCASAVYVLNDLLDLESDRQHIRKRARPFASGVIPVWQGVVLVPVLLGASILLAMPLPVAFFAVLTVYFSITLAYSLRLKRQVIVDVMLLAALYTMRIVAGAAATGIVPSFWLLAFSMFIFLSLAIVKRYSELLITLQQQKASAAGRGYFVSDLPVLASIGAASGMAAVLVLALYINDPETARLYPNKMWLWLVPPAILYWITRVWLKTCRSEIDDDPVVFAIKDWQSLVVGTVLAGCFTLAASQSSTFFIG